MTARVCIFTTHPIQYQVPWFRSLARRSEVDLTVLYCMMPSAAEQGAEFGVEFQWDVPLLDGYHYEVLPNVARRPSVVSFGGCDTPEIFRRVHAFDCLIINGWVTKACVQAMLAGRRHRVPCVVRGESNTMRPRPFPLRLGHRLLLAQYTAALAIGRSNRDFYLRNGVPAQRIFEGPYCVDNERFERQAQELQPQREELRSRWGIAPEAVAFLFCGKLIDKKRPLDLLRAVALLAGEGGPACHVIVAGEGPLRPACEAFARERRIAATFTGFLNQSAISRAYVASDCLVLPSDHGETWGLVVNEAMASGRPAIVSDQVGCHPDLIAPGHTGDVFPCGDVDALSRTLASWSRAPERLALAGEHARAQVHRYSVSRVVDGTLEAVRFATGPAA